MDRQVSYQDARWESVSQFSPMDNRAFVVMEFEGKLIVGGEFNAAGGVVLNHIGSWDGSEWQPLGEGFNYAVKCLGVYQGQLVAGGDFTASGFQSTSHVAIWNGTQWESMGEGFDGSPTSFAEWEGRLVAGGWFSHAGDHSRTSPGAALPYAAVWDGTHWSAMGQVGDGTALSAPARDLIVHDGSLLAAGSFTCWCPGQPLPQPIARWNGSAWIPAGPHLHPDQMGGKPVASCFAIWDSMLVVGGTFSRLDSLQANGVIGFVDGEWLPLGSGIRPGVLDIVVHQNLLFASGSFGGTSVAEWNGTSWQSIPSLSFTRRLASYQGLLYGIGEFSYTDQIRAWNGTAWLPLPTTQGESLAKFPDPVHALLRYADRVFLHPDWLPPTDLEDRLNAFSYGRGLHGLHGAQPAWDCTQTHPYAQFRGSLITRSWPVMGLYSWDGLSNTTIPAPPSGMPTAMTTLDDRLIAASYPTNCAKQVWTWDGTSWSPFADALCTSETGDLEWGRWGIVRVLAPYRGQLVAGGFFSYDEDTYHNLAAWTGAAWTPLRDCPDDMVTCLIEYHGDLIAAGFFDHVGQVAASGIARWDGTEWHPLGLGTDGPIYTMAIHNDRLVVGGYFQQAGGEPAGSIAAWDGTGWLELDSGVDGEVLTMVSNLGTLWVGGEFSRAGGQTSFHLAKWMEGPRTATFSNLTAERGPNGVLVTATASYVPFGHEGFLVYRQSPDEAPVSLTTTPIQGEEISFTDGTPPIGPVTYLIAGVASTGLVTTYASTEVAADPSLRFALLPAQPNPFSAGTSISFQNAQAGRIQVSVFDLQGRCVARVVDRSFAPGAHSVTWNGRDTSGRTVSAGTYFCRLTGTEGTRVQSLVRSGF